MTRDELDRLLDVRDALQRIAHYRALVRSGEPSSQDRVFLDAILYNLVILGEAVRCLPDRLRASEPDVPWRDIIDFRNLAAHEYFRINSDRVWKIADMHLPILRDAITRMAGGLDPDFSTAGG